MNQRFEQIPVGGRLIIPTPAVATVTVCLLIKMPSKLNYKVGSSADSQQTKLATCW